MKSCAGSVEKIFLSAVRAAHAGNAVRSVLSADNDAIRCIRRDGSLFEYQLHPSGRLIVVGAGKATAAMALAAEDILGTRISSGIISVKYGHTEQLRYIQQIEASHPVPDSSGVAAAQSIMQCVHSAGERDLVIVLVSGGASALLPLPAEGITLEDKQQTTKLLLACGASIHEINCVRKHLSAVKGGQLARAAYPAHVLSLCISDVVGDDISVIGSGICAADPYTFQDALDVVKKYGIEEKIPSAVYARLGKGAEGFIAETPKARDICLSKAENIICMSNAIALKAAEREAIDTGFDVLTLSSSIDGDTTDAARSHADIVREMLERRSGMEKPVAVISGGETTVQVTGSGIGGRNMEFVLRCAIELEHEDGICIASAGTDGTDGPTDAAGAWITTEMVRSFRKEGVIPERYAEDNDSYSYFKKTGTLIKTGPTGTNVLDIRIIIVYPMNET